jgi:hypothetical protein
VWIIGIAMQRAVLVGAILEWPLTSSREWLSACSKLCLRIKRRRLGILVLGHPQQTGGSNKVTTLRSSRAIFHVDKSLLRMLLLPAPL